MLHESRNMGDTPLKKILARYDDFMPAILAHREAEIVKVNTSLGKMFKRPHQCKYVHSGTHLI
jgi:hypothetical protein